MGWLFAASSNNPKNLQPCYQTSEIIQVVFRTKYIHFQEDGKTPGSNPHNVGNKK